MNKDERAVWRGGGGGIASSYSLWLVNPGWAGFEKDNCRETEQQVFYTALFDRAHFTKHGMHRVCSRFRTTFARACVRPISS